MILPTCRKAVRLPAIGFSPNPLKFRWQMAYVPFQRWCPTYEPEVGFNRGTMFPELDKPFLGEEAVSRGR